MILSGRSVCVLLVWLALLALGSGESPAARPASRTLPNRAELLGALLDRPSSSSSSSSASSEPFDPLILHSSLPSGLGVLISSQLSAFYDPLLTLLQVVESIPDRFLTALSASSYSSPSSRKTSRLTSSRDTPSPSPSPDSSTICSGVGVAHGVELVQCYCPLDYVGPRCERRREFRCDVDLEQPLPSCEPSQSPRVHGGDPVCFSFRRASDRPSFSYRLRCAFTSDPTPQHQLPPAPNVTADWLALLKVFNFNRPSDLGASQQQQLSPDHILGLQPFSFTLPLADYSPQYLLGGRLYFETGVFSSATYVPPGMPSRTVDARFIDFEDYRPTGTPSFTPELPGWAIFLIIAASFFSALALLKLSLFAWKRYKRSQKLKLKKKKHT